MVVVGGWVSLGFMIGSLEHYTWLTPTFGPYLVAPSIGKNPVFEKRERERKLKAERRKLQQMREEDKKTADL